MQGLSGNNVKLNPDPPYVGPVWFLVLQGTATLTMSFVDVYWSDASANPIVIPLNVNRHRRRPPSTTTTAG